MGGTGAFVIILLGPIVSLFIRVRVVISLFTAVIKIRNSLGTLVDKISAATYSLLGGLNVRIVGRLLVSITEPSLVGGPFLAVGLSSLLTIDALEGSPGSLLEPVPGSLLTNASGTLAHQIHNELDQFCVRNSRGSINSFGCFGKDTVFLYKAGFFSHLTVKIPHPHLQGVFSSYLVPLFRRNSFLQVPRTERFIYIDIHSPALYQHLIDSVADTSFKSGEVWAKRSIYLKLSRILDTGVEFGIDLGSICSSHEFVRVTSDTRPYSLGDLRGLIKINTGIRVSYLNQCQELSSFINFCKVHSSLDLTQARETITVSYYRPRNIVVPNVLDPSNRR